MRLAVVHNSYGEYDLVDYVGVVSDPAAEAARVVDKALSSLSGFYENYTSAINAGKGEDVAETFEKMADIIEEVKKKEK